MHCYTRFNCPLCGGLMCGGCSHGDRRRYLEIMSLYRLFYWYSLFLWATELHRCPKLLKTHQSQTVAVGDMPLFILSQSHTQYPWESHPRRTNLHLDLWPVSAFSANKGSSGFVFKPLSLNVIRVLQNRPLSMFLSAGMIDIHCPGAVHDHQICLVVA